MKQFATGPAGQCQHIETHYFHGFQCQAKATDEINGVNLCKKHAESDATHIDSPDSPTFWIVIHGMPAKVRPTTNPIQIDRGMFTTVCDAQPGHGPISIRLNAKGRQWFSTFNDVKEYLIRHHQGIISDSLARMKAIEAIR
jgi:hypothetical protein